MSRMERSIRRIGRKMMRMRRMRMRRMGNRFLIEIRFGMKWLVG